VKRPPSIISRVLLLAGAASLLLAGFIAVHPAAHEWLHAAACPHDHGHDAEKPAHECAATLLATGLADAATVPLPTVGFAGGEVQGSLPSSVRLAIAFHDRFPPGRAPPVSLHEHDFRHSS
jgi:hypothetical protein